MSTATVHARNSSAPFAGDRDEAWDSDVPMLRPTVAYQTMWPKAKVRPFAPSVYDDSEVFFEPEVAGFPRAETVILPWVPGVSTPEGMVLVGSAALLMTELGGSGGEALVRFAQTSLTVMFSGIAVGIPAASLWLGATLQPMR